MDDENCSTSFGQAWDPCREHPVKCLLADFDGGIAPDHIESNVLRCVGRVEDDDVSHPEIR
ncbi:MAG: hypothetical protein RLZ37_1985 [Actinomycetota bacterium]